MKLNMLTTDVEKEEQPATIVNEDGVHISVNEEFAELYGLSTEEMEGISIADTHDAPELKTGKFLQMILGGNTTEAKNVAMKRPGKSDMVMDFDFEKTTRCDEADCCTKCVKMVVTDYREVDSEPAADDRERGEVSASAFDTISEEQLREIIQSVRVDGPEAEIPLEAIMLDVTEGHYDLEKYKNGAFTLYSAVDERLAEEEKHNPDSPTAQVLEEVKEAVYGLYLRVERGDKELQGDRAGEYSDYFN
jgi:hypothetical protein